MKANKYDYSNAIKSKLKAENIDLTDTESCKIVLGRCVMGSRLIKKYCLISKDVN